MDRREATLEKSTKRVNLMEMDVSLPIPDTLGKEHSTLAKLTDSFTAETLMAYRSVER